MKALTCALSLLVACVPPPNPEPVAWGTASGAPPAGATTAVATRGGASCRDTLACYTQCSMTDACLQSCDARSAPEDAAHARATLGCIAQSGCTDDTCVAQRCTAEIDACGDLVTPTVATATAPAPAPAPAPATGPLTTPPPGRTLTVADLAGDWVEDEHALQNYASASTGQYTGYSAVLTSDHYVFDGKGGYSVKSQAVISSSGGATGMESKGVGAVTISRDNVLELKRTDLKYPVFYYLRGWEVRPDVTVLKVNGPYNTAAEAEPAVDPHYAQNLDRYWVRVSPNKP